MVLKLHPFMKNVLKFYLNFDYAKTKDIEILKNIFLEFLLPR